MLNYNTIGSSINFQRTVKSKLAKFIGIPNSTLIDRLEKENLTPDDVEKIAEYFGKPIAYFFDKEEKDVVGESEIKYFNCPECIKKQKLIDELTTERDNFRNKYIECLEELAGRDKKENLSETGT